MSLFTENDLRLLDKTLDIREKLVDHLMKDGFPKKARDIDSFVNILESIDRSILGKTKIKVENDANKTKEETKEILRELLLELHSNSTYNTIEDKTINEIPEYQPSENIKINEGELIPRLDNLDPSEILEK